MRESKIWKWQDSLRQGVRKIVMKEEGERNNPLFLGVFFIVVGFGLLGFFIYLLFLKEEVELLGNRWKNFYSSCPLLFNTKI